MFPQDLERQTVTSASYVRRPDWNRQAEPATDGHSLWAADTPAASAATVGEHPRIGAPPVTWAVTPAGSIFGTQWTYIAGVRIEMRWRGDLGRDDALTRIGRPGPVPPPIEAVR